MIKNTSTILRYRIGTLNQLCCDDDQVVGTSQCVIDRGVSSMALGLTPTLA